MAEEVGVEQASHAIRQAFEYATAIVESSRTMTHEAMGFPRRDGQPRDDRYEQASGHRPEEDAATGYLSAYFALSADLSKLKAAMVETWVRLDSGEHGHERAYRFADEVAFRVRDSLHLEDHRFPATVERPNTQEQWDAAAKDVAPYLPSLKRRLADMTVPDKEAVELAMSAERRAAKTPADEKADAMSVSKTAPKGTSGRKSNDIKRKHAELANVIRGRSPQPTWMTVAKTVNEKFNLTGRNAYSDEQIRELHRHHCGDKAQKKKRA